MQSTIFDLLDAEPSSYGRTSPECSPSKTTPSGASSGRLSETMTPSSRQGESGQVRVWLWDRKDQQRGEFSTLNISEWPNDAVVCSLSQVLETDSIPQKFFLSAKACAGILRRAESRGKILPVQLQQALARVCEGLKE